MTGLYTCECASQGHPISQSVYIFWEGYTATFSTVSNAPIFLNKGFLTLLKEKRERLL
jgi:hypothetical protein